MKIVITARDFSQTDKTGLQLLQDTGHEIIDYSIHDMGSGTSENELYEVVKDADIAIAGLEPYSASLIKKCPNLKMISRRGIGYDSVDLEACKESGIVLSRTAGLVEGAVAEHVLSYILYFARRIDLQNSSMQQGQWQRMLTPGAKNRTLGLIGFGGIGKEIAKRAVPFGMKVLYHCRHPRPEWEKEYQVQYADLDPLLSQSNYVSLNVPLSDHTRGMFDNDKFSKMKPGSIFINIARSQVMDVMALKNALLTGHLGGAAVDVFEAEPCTDSPLIGCPNTILTPHTAPYTSENFIEMNNAAAQNVIDYLNGSLNPENRVI